MATYDLLDIHINTSSGVPVVSISGRGTDPVSGCVYPVRKDAVPLTGPAATRVTNLMQDALTYLSAQYGVTVTLPPVAPVPE